MTFKLNPEVKARWVAALRSGEYKQARGGGLHPPRENFPRPIAARA